MDAVESQHLDIKRVLNKGMRTGSGNVFVRSICRQTHFLDSNNTPELNKSMQCILTYDVYRVSMKCRFVIQSKDKRSSV